MLSLRNRFGIPGVISVIALVFALVGGAYAAENSDSGATASAKKNNRAKKRKAAGLNAKQKRQVIALAKRFASAGPQGPQGVPGLPGAPGAKGDKGSDGSNGSNGSNGKDGDSVVSSALNPGDLNCAEGGTQFDVGGNTTYACNGAEGTPGTDGDPWTAGGTLPTGATQTGTWVISDNDPTTNFVSFVGVANIRPISFPVPLPSGLTSSKFKFTPNGGNPDANCENPDHAGEASAANPEASAGFICVYASEDPKVPITTEQAIIGLKPSPALAPATLGADVSGFLLAKKTTTEGTFWGTWAVTGG